MGLFSRCSAQSRANLRGYSLERNPLSAITENPTNDDQFFHGRIHTYICVETVDFFARMYPACNFSDRLAIVFYAKFKIIDLCSIYPDNQIMTESVILILSFFLGIPMA